MNSLTSHVLHSASRLITTWDQSPPIRSKQGFRGQFQPDQPNTRKEIQSANQPHSPNPCRLSNWSWRGASRRPNGQGVNCTTGARRGAGQPVVQADGRMLATHASVRRRSSAAA
jgi:hypothetical protein